MKAQPAAQQQTLARPVCLQANGQGQTCTYLAGHKGKHRSGGGKEWK